MYQDYEKIIENSYLDLRINYLYRQMKKKEILVKKEFFVDLSVDITEKNLRELFENIRKHIGIRKKTSLFLKKLIETESENIVGAYQKGVLENEIITVKMHPKYNYGNYAAIMAHELSHQFMSENNFNRGENQSNERNTDILAIFLGFGNIMELAYRSVVTQFSEIKWKELKLGYLYDDEIRYIKRKIEKLRDKEEKKLKERLKNEEINKKYEEYQDIIKKLFLEYQKNCSYLEIVKKKSNDNIKLNDFKTIWDNMKEKENGLDSKIRIFSNIELKSLNNEKIEELKKEAKKYTLNLNIWNSTLLELLKE